MSRVGNLYAAIEPADGAWRNRRSPGAYLARQANTVSSPVIKAYAAVGRMSRLVTDYCRVLCELESLTDKDLRDLQFEPANFFTIARAEALRRYRESKVAAQLQR